jgi:hypothetical protein
MNYLLTVPGVICLAVASGKFSPLKKSRWTSLLAAAAALPVVLGILAAAVSFSDITLTGCLFRIREQFAVSFLESWKIAVWNGQSFANSVHGLVNLPRMLFPWSLPALIVTAGMIRKWKELTPVHKKLLLGTILLFVCTGLFPGRRWQYQLCQLPLFLVITAGGICRIAGEELWVSWNDRIMKWGLALLCSFAVSVVVFWPLWDMVFYEDMPWSIIAGIPLLGLAGLGFLIFDTGSTSRVEMISGMRGSWSGYILAGVCFSTAVFAVGIPELGSYRTGKIFWQKCGAELKKNPAELLFYGKHPDAEAAYYMRLSGNCTTAADREMLNRQLLKIYENSQSCFVIVQEKDLPAFQEVIAAAGWRFDPVEALVVEGLPFHMAGKSDVDTSRNYFFCIKK